MIDPELTLNDAERVELNSVVTMRGFEHVKRLALAECGRFDVQLKNLEPSSSNYDAQLRQYHALAKAASQFWVGLLARIESEIQQLIAGQKAARPLKDLKPEEIEPDITAELMES